MSAAQGKGGGGTRRKGGESDAVVTPDADAETKGVTAGDEETGAVTVATETPEEAAEELEEEEVERVAAKAEPTGPRHRLRALRHLYRGETSFDFVGKRRWWFLLSATIIVAGLVSLGFRGLNLGIDFKGGTAWIIRTSSLSQAKAQSLVTAAGISQPTVEVLGSGSQRTIEVQADLNYLPTTTTSRKGRHTRHDLSNRVQDALAKGAGVSPKDVSVTHVGPSWGSQVTQKAIEALVIFFIAVAVYISLRFEPKMALAAFIAMVHDLLVTVGVYSLLGFQVSPDTVIAVLTILGYSLYDTVVVFDRVRDNMKGFGASGRLTYTEMINLSMNQTLARSINTSLVAILPVLSVLVIGAEFLGAFTLQNYGLALTVGLLSGAYSSIFIAAPVLAILKEREPRYVAIRQRLESRADRLGLLTPAAAAALVGASAATSGRAARVSAGGTRGGTLRPSGARGGARQGGGGPRPSAAGAARAGGASGTGAARGPTGARTGGGTGPRRPPPRPRKGGGKGKKRR